MTDDCYKEAEMLFHERIKEMDTARFNLNYCIGYIESAHKNQQPISDGNIEDLIPKLEQVYEALRTVRW